MSTACLSLQRWVTATAEGLAVNAVHRPGPRLSVVGHAAIRSSSALLNGGRSFTVFLHMFTVFLHMHIISHVHDMNLCPGGFLRCCRGVGAFPSRSCCRGLVGKQRGRTSACSSC